LINTKEAITRTAHVVFIGVAFLASTVSAQTADELVARYIKAVGGTDKVSAITSLRRSGKFVGGGGFEAPLLEENKRPNLVRQEFTMSGLTGVTAYDGTAGWKIEPWGGKKEPEPLGEEELKAIVEDSDFDGPLVDYRQKGNTIGYVGMEPVEGTDAYKLRVVLASGDVRYYYLDTDYYVPIKVEIKRIVRGAEREYEIVFGDYKEVSGWYLPHSVESNVKGSLDRSKVMYDKIEANVPIENSRFAKPVPAEKAR